MNTINEINMKLAKAFGLEMKNLLKFELWVQGDRLPEITATYIFVDGNEILNERRAFNVVPFDEDEAT